MKLLFPFLIIIFILSSCKEDIVVKLKDSEPRIFIEGFVTYGNGPFQVKVRKTNDFQDNNPYKGISNAFVIIKDDQGQLDTLKEVAEGIYETQRLQGIDNRTYSLQVQTNGTSYEASCFMPAYHGYDTLFYEYLEESTSVQEAGYYVSTIGHEPPGLGNYYRINVYKNDSLFDGPADYFISDDAFIDGNIIYNKLFFFKFEKGDTAKVELQNISGPHYFYLLSLVKQLNTGGPFAPPSDNVKGNISNGALGFFGAYSAYSDTVHIPK